MKKYLFLLLMILGFATNGYAGGQTIFGDLKIYDADPAVIFIDSSCTDKDDHAKIYVNATDTGSGTEDIDYYFQQMIAGSLATWLHVDADGDVDFQGRNITTTANMAAATIDLTGVTDTYIPYMKSGAAGLDESVLSTDGTHITTAGNIYANDAAGPAFANEAATTTNPTIIPDKAEMDTGIGWASDTLHFVLGGVDAYSFSTSTFDVNSNTITEAGNITATNAAGPSILNEAATSTNPTLNPNRAEADTGIGWASDKLHIVLGGVDEYEFGTSEANFKGNYATQLQNIPDLASRGASLVFDGVDDKVTVADDANLDWGTGDFSILTSFNVVGTASGYVVAHNDYANASCWGIRTNSNEVVFRADAEEAKAYSLTTMSAPINTQKIITYIRSGDDLLGYANGELLINSIDHLTGASFSPGVNLYLGTSAHGSYFNGQISRTLLFNLALTADEVKALSSGGEVPYKYNGDGDSPASQTEQTSGTLVIGKAYRINDWITNDDFTNVGGTNEDGNEFVATGTTPTTWTNSSTVVRIGCVLNLNPSGIGHKMWVDNSGNDLNGTVSGALATNRPVDHREKYIALTVTGDTLWTNVVPAGYMLTRMIFEETAGNTGTLSLGTSDGATDVFVDQTITASSITVVQINKMWSVSAAQTLDLNDDGSGTWNSASVNVTLMMERVDIN